MSTTRAAIQHDQQSSPIPTQQTPQGQTSGHSQPEHVSESSPPLHRYLGNSYVQAMTAQKQHLGLQTKLTVNEPGDIYEQEADRVADQVMAAPTHAHISSAPLQIRRFSESSHGQVGPAPASVGKALASPGRPLEPALRQDMEQRFGHDFSQVRVHTDATAEQSAQDVNAHAYTMGHDLVFDAGRFAPETTEGRRLIAHELTHVVQQAGGGAPFIQRKEKKGQHHWTTVTQITVEAGATGEGRGRALTSDGQTIPINITVNKLSPGRITTGKLLLGSSPENWREIHLESEGAHPLVYNLPPGVTLGQTTTIIVKPSREQQARARINALPPRIRDFLTSGKRKLSGEDLLKAASAGQILEKHGVTADELLLQQQRRIDRQEVGLQQAEYADLEDWASSYVGSREQARAAQQASATTLLRTTERLSLASLNLYQQDPLLEIVDPESPISALATLNAIQSKETRPMRGLSEKVETPFRDLGDLRTTLQAFENALVADLRTLATSFLDDTEVRLIRMQDQFVGQGGKGWGPGYLEREIEKVKNDPDVVNVQKEHEELTRAIDQEQQEDDQNYREHQHVRWWADAYYKRKKERQGRREQEQQRYRDSLRQTVAKKSKLQLPPGFDVGDILSADSGRRAQAMLSNFIVDGRAKVREAREKLSDPRFLYAADIVINKEKELLRQALAARSDYNRYQEEPFERALDKGFAAKRWNTVNWIIDKLASERRAQTTIWQDIVKVFEYVSMVIPGPIGWAARFAGAAANLDQNISAARNQDVSYSTGLSEVASDPNAGSRAFGKFIVEGMLDKVLSPTAKGAAPLTLGLGSPSRPVVDEAAKLGERGVATAPGNQATRPPVSQNVPQKPQGVIYAATDTGHVVPINVGKGITHHHLSGRVPRPPAARPPTRPPQNQPQVRGGHSHVIPRDQPRRGFEDEEPTLVDLEPAGGGSRGSATPSGGGPSQIPDTVQGETPRAPRAQEPSATPSPGKDFEEERTEVEFLPAGAAQQESRATVTPSGRPSQGGTTASGVISESPPSGTSGPRSPSAGATQGQTHRVHPNVLPNEGPVPPPRPAPPRQAAEKPQGAASAEREAPESTLGARPEPPVLVEGAERLYQNKTFQEARERLQPLVDQINPGRGTQNCVRVTIAMDKSLATRKAFTAPVILEPTGVVEEVATRWGPLRVKQVTEVASTRRHLESYTDAKMKSTGARGLMHELRGPEHHGARAIIAKMGEEIGHAYNVVNWRGMLIAVDAQSGTIRPFAEVYAEMVKNNDDWTMMWYRTDSLPRSRKRP